ncbi:MAG: hypothetical protein CL677_02865 [Bdellovibrionaceae bacterium]|nr:hypothetical protein [Pseudobdellovibrionaceae bacterium]|tara:strand:- start:434 stop:1585 length:1152 start_codon:yes stop_codon:yes gene_type:complete
MEKIQWPDNINLCCLVDSENEDSKDLSYQVSKWSMGVGQFHRFSNPDELYDFAMESESQTLIINLNFENKIKQYIKDKLGAEQESLPVLHVISEEPEEMNLEESTLSIKGLEVGQLKQSLVDAYCRWKLEKHIKALEFHVAEISRLRMINKLTSSAAHDLANKLTAVSALTHKIEKRLLTGDTVTEELLRIRKLMDSSGKLSKKLQATEKHHGPNRERIVLADSVYKCLELIESSIEDKVEIDFNNRCHSGRVKIDELHLDQILLNLVINAKQAFGGQGYVLVEVDEVEFETEVEGKFMKIPPGQYVSLSVFDNGQGISKEHILKIFRRHFTTKIKQGGTGLGLNTVYELVQLNKGYIEVESDVGEGTGFRLYFRKINEESMV